MPPTIAPDHSAMTDALPVRAGTLPRLLFNPPARALAAHVERFGPLPTRPADLIDAVARAGLRGRGGAGFPTAIKLDAVARRSRAVVVANGTEGEPTSAKDKTLLTLAPHLVLDGAVMAAQAVGAQRVIVCVERSSAAAIDALHGALAERGDARLDRVPLELALTPNRYVGGEESALVHWLNGGDAKPTFVPPRPFERGVGGRPTLVDNVETLAHLALIGRYGAAWWRSVGTAEDPGSALVSVSGAVARPVVCEVPLGTPLTDVLRAAGGSLGSVRAVLVGGYFGTWIPADAIDGVRLGVDSLARAGASLGCGALVVLPAEACGLWEVARVTRWLASQSAGQCGPCVFGLPAIADAMDALVSADRSDHAERQLVRWLGMVKGRGACKHPDGAARFVESSLRVFAGEIARHRGQGPCPPGVPVLPVPAPGAWR